MFPKRKKIFHGIAHMNTTVTASKLMCIPKVYTYIPKVHSMRVLEQNFACALVPWII